jgi:hypothetical protein
MLKSLSLSGIWLVAALPACASLHHVQIGELDPPRSVQGGASGSEEFKMIRFEVIESGTGFEAGEAGAGLRAVGSSSLKMRQSVKGAEDAFEAITFGPRTGSLVFNDRFPDVIPTKIRQACPSGRVTGLVVTRETAKYPVVSGEVVRVTGYCID